MKRAKTNRLYFAFHPAGVFGQSGDSLANRNRPALDLNCRADFGRNTCLSLLEKQKRLEVM